MLNSSPARPRTSTDPDRPHRRPHAADRPWQRRRPSARNQLHRRRTPHRRRGRPAQDRRTRRNSAIITTAPASASSSSACPASRDQPRDEGSSRSRPREPDHRNHVRPTPRTRDPPYRAPGPQSCRLLTNPHTARAGPDSSGTHSWEIRDDIHDAFMAFGAALSCWRRLAR